MEGSRRETTYLVVQTVRVLVQAETKELALHRAGQSTWHWNNWQVADDPAPTVEVYTGGPLV